MQISDVEKTASNNNHEGKLTTIDFTRIRSTPKSRNDSFEALAVQLFRKCAITPPDSTFISLRGDGGDGGVEAYFRTPAGQVIGVQAKYFFTLTASELVQISESLKTARENHPTLSEYHVYIPFDLTGRVAAGSRGVSQAERFEAWKTAAEQKAADEGAPLKIELCMASIVRSQLNEVDAHGGLRRYWFDEEILTIGQIERLLAQAKASAGPRYSATLDIETNAHFGLDLFGGIGDYQSWFDASIAPLVGNLRSYEGVGSDAFDLLEVGTRSKTVGLIETVLRELKLAASSDTVSDTSALQGHLNELLPLVVALREAQEADFYAKHGKDKDTPGFRQFNAEMMCTFPAGNMDFAREYEDAVLNLISALSSPEARAASNPSLLLVGPAGIGKTHAIVSAAYRRLDHGGMSLVTFGEDFDGREPWEVLRTKFGFGGNVGREAMFECMEACAANTKLPFVIFIDALNETDNRARWKRKLPSFLTELAPYPGIKVCFSTRDTYFSQVIDSSLQHLSFKHVGFAGNEFIALQAFAEHYKLDSEITPLFSSELRNPLFLRLVCEVLVAEGRQTLDLSLPGLNSLIERHLRACDVLVRGRLDYANPKNLVRYAIVTLAKILVDSAPANRTWNICARALEEEMGSRERAEKLLRELEHENLIIISVDERDVATVRMGYQRYGDSLRAIHGVESCVDNGLIDTTKLAAFLASLSGDDKGLFEAIAAVLPEKYQIEITDERLGLDIETAYQAYVQSLSWRSRSSFDSDTDVRIYAALRVPGLWRDVYEALFSLCLVPGHMLNAEHWLRPFLGDDTLTHRDTFLSFAAADSYGSTGAVSSLINSGLKADITRWPKESRELAMEAFGWLTSCSDRRVRDLSGKALTRLIGFDPDLGGYLASSFAGCEDDYINEYVCLAIYSACLLTKKEEHSKFATAVELLLKPAWRDCANVLVRDTIQLAAKLLAGDGFLREEAVAKIGKWAKQPLPKVWPTIEDAKPLLELKGLPSNMKLWGDMIGPDFWRYQVQPRMRSVDLNAAGITLENIASWIMVETLRMGYPGEEKQALLVDRQLMGQYGGGRGREGFAERLGKKYYWIALHRLLAILADNVPAKEQYSATVMKLDRLWSVDVRKVDLTDVRDIAEEKLYPDEVLRGDRYPFPPQEGDMKDWVQTRDFSPPAVCLSRTANDGVEWIPLNLVVSDNNRPAEDSYGADSYLSVDNFYNGVFVKKNPKTPSMREKIRGIASHDCSTYRGYIAEYPHIEVYEQLANEGMMYMNEGGAELCTMTLLRGGEWQYDFSSEEDQDSLDVPCPSIVQELGLSWDKQRGWTNNDGELVVFFSRMPKRSSVFVRRKDMNLYLEKTGKKLVFSAFANKIFVRPNGASPLVDIHTDLLYVPDGVPEVLHEDIEQHNF